MRPCGNRPTREGGVCMGMLRPSAGAFGQGFERVRPLLELTRPPNLATAAADVLAGFGIVGLVHPAALAPLLASTVCLYAGGVVLNDVCDSSLDAVERPE